MTTKQVAEPLVTGDGNTDVVGSQTPDRPSDLNGNSLSSGSSFHSPDSSGGSSSNSSNGIVASLVAAYERRGDSSTARNAILYVEL